VCDTEWLTVVGTDTETSQVDGSKPYTMIHTQILSDASTIILLLFKKLYWKINEKQLPLILLQWLFIHKKVLSIIIQAGLVIMKWHTLMTGGVW
jgi:hypothetical protein